MAMSDPTYPLFSVFAFLGFFLALIPLPWHFQAWNSGTCYYMLWASIACLNQFVNSVVWAGNALNPAPIWCDISIRIMMGASVGLPAASLCINRRLHQIATVQTVSISRAEKQRVIIIDTLICVLFPAVFIAIQYFVQGHRFNIFEDIGCYPALYNTLLTYFLSTVWPLIIGLISAVYCALSIRAFSRRRVEFNQFLTSNKSLTSSRYFRLMALAMTEILLTTPLSIYIIWLDLTTSPLGPWRSLADTHFAFSRVEQIPSVLWRSNHQLVIALELNRWVNPLCALVFFAFFGFASEARKNYSVTFWAVARRFSFSPPTPQSYLPSPSIGLKHNIKMSKGSAPAFTLNSPPPPLYRKGSESLESAFSASYDGKSHFTDISDTRCTSHPSLISTSPSDFRFDPPQYQEPAPPIVE